MAEKFDQEIAQTAKLLQAHAGYEQGEAEILASRLYWAGLEVRRLETRSRASAPAADAGVGAAEKLRHWQEVEDYLDAKEREALAVLGEFTVCETEDGDVGVFRLPFAEDSKSLGIGDTVREAIIAAAAALRSSAPAAPEGAK